MSFETLGWQVFAHEAAIKAWADHVLPIAQDTAQDTSYFKDWLRCGDTWFVGVNALPNDVHGQVGSGPQLSGKAYDFVISQTEKLPLDRAQVSVIYPGYPKPSDAETDAAFRFRRDRDAAHVDGLRPVGPTKRRYLLEPHAYVLGIPLNATSASPMVVWDGSHQIMRAAFLEKFAGIAPENWADTDLTDTYQAARRTCFETCQRREISVPVGGAYLIHRLSLHGVAPWKDTDTAPKEGRIIAYFRPPLPDIKDWLA